jgi:glucosylglycerol-phosphate synthase
VHDYNLWLVPGYLRTLRPDVKISFFHHTPFPNADIFNVLPWRKEILESLLCCDVVGFHIPRYANNFVSAARSLLDVETLQREKVKPEMKAETSALSEQSVVTELGYEGRKIRLQSSPVGVDVDYIETLSQSEATAAKVKQIKQEIGDGQLILSVGRTDYTKGGIEQLASYERLLENRPDLRGKVRLMHVSVAANSNMTAYEEIQQDLEQMAGRINGRYGTFDWQPIALISRPVPFDQLVAYYRAADVAWITPLADGMNLVCKEYCAARTDEDGVLVLSEFAGAAVELATAVPTNPFSHKSMDGAIEYALDLPKDERRGRMRLNREMVRKLDIRNWAEDQMQAFGGDQGAVIAFSREVA